MKKTPVVISVGGSLIVPNEIDTRFIKNFKRLVIDQVKNGKRFVIVTGGGAVARKYNEALKAVTKASHDDQDWMGINSTWLNAKLIQLAFGTYAHQEIIKDPAKLPKTDSPVIVCGGWKPGRSSDGAMVKYAQNYKAKTVINLSNIDYVYEKDPKKFPNAKILKNISWKDFRKIVGNKWLPGANLPFDPTAAKDAEQNGMTVIIAKGSNLNNLKNILKGQDYIGTTIS